MPPDLSTAEGRRAYRRELAGIARPFRWLGLGMVAIGLAAIGLAPHPAGQVIGWSLIGFGWLQVAIRTTYHRRRIAGD